LPANQSPGLIFGLRSNRPAASLRLSSAVIIRTHKHRLKNKREPLFRSNHWWRAPLVHC
jgi:hypothetical protein